MADKPAEIDRVVQRMAGRSPAASPAQAGLNAASTVEQLRALVSSRHLEGLPEVGIVTLEEGRKYFTGTTLQIVQPEWVTTAGGLIIPKSVGVVTPFDLIQSYVTASDFLGRPLGGDELVAALQRRPIGHALRFVAYWMGHLDKPDISTDLLERQFIDSYFGGDSHSRALGMMRSKRRILVPQLLLALAKAAIAVCPEDPPKPDLALDDLPLVTAMLGIADHLGVGSKSVDVEAEGPKWGGLPPELALEMTSNLYFNSSYDEASLITRFVRMWVELASAADPNQQRSFAALFEEATGLSLMDVVTGTLAVWAHCVGGNFAVAPAYFKDTALGEPGGKQILDFLSADRRRLAEALGEEVADAFDWTYSTFERYPIVRMTNGDYLVLSPNLLLNRVFGGLCYFDALSKFGKNKKRKGALVQLRGDVTASFVLEGLERMFPPLLGGQKRVFTESDVQASLGGGQVCDAVVDYGDAFLLFEVTFRRLTREAAAGRSIADLDNEIKNLIHAKGEQLDSTIKALRATPSALTAGTELRRRYFPIIVVDDQFPVFPSMVEEYSNRLREAGFLEGPEVAPLEILSLEELDLVEGIFERHGKSLRDLLEMKARANLGHMSLKNFALVELRLFGHRPQRVGEQFKQFMKKAASHLNL